MTKTKLFIWNCDYSETSGEGKLARLFIKHYKINKKFILKFNQKKIIKYKYFSSLQGIIFCWIKYLNKEKVCYLNYLPFWNFLIFLLLPPQTIIGPITGGSNFEKSITAHYLIRKFIFPFFYKISEILIFIRFQDVVFSTNLLKKYISKKNHKRCHFNFILSNVNYIKKAKKKYDFIIYHRKHQNKSSFFPYNFLKKLSDENFKIIVVGDRLQIGSIINFGFVTNKTVNYLQSKSRFSIASGENIYSFFTLECISNNVKILFDESLKKQISTYKKKFIPINFNKDDYKKIFKELKKIK